MHFFVQSNIIVAKSPMLGVRKTEIVFFIGFEKFYKKKSELPKSEDQSTKPKNVEEEKSKIPDISTNEKPPPKERLPHNESNAGLVTQ